jgi:hypothetical protein
VLSGLNLPILAKLALVRDPPIAEPARMANEAVRKYMASASRILVKKGP